jgi:hypothetical protein
MKNNPQMRKYIKIAVLLTLAIALTNSYLMAQNQKIWQWLRPMGGQLWDRHGGLGCDSENNLYVIGSFMDVFHCKEQSITAAGSSDIFVAQYDEEGNIIDLWQGGGKRNDEAFCMAVSKNNDVLIGGIITDTVTMGNLYSPGRGQRLFVAKLGTSGDFSWMSTLVSSNASLFLLATDSNGKIYAAGAFNDNLSAGGFTLNSQGGQDIFLARFNSEGVIEHLTAFGGIGNDIPSAFSMTESGQILLAGSSTHPGSFQGIPLDPVSAPYQTGSFIAALDENFNYSWKTQILSSEYINLSGLGTDPQGNIYAGGSFGFNMALADTVIATKGVTDGFIIKYDMSGSVLWSRSIGSWYYNYVNDLAVDKYGRAVISGSLGDTLEIDGLILNGDANSAMAIQFSPKGKALWADCITGSGRNFNDNVVFDKNANLFLAGSFTNTIEKDTATYTSTGDQDLYLAMFYSCPTDRAEILGKEAICPGSSIELSIHEGYNHVLWNDTLNDALQITVDKPGRYWVTMNDDHSCNLADTTDIRMEEITGFSLGEDLSIPVDSSVILQGPEDFSDFTWQDDTHNNTMLASALNQEPGTQLYWLTAVDPKGCFEADTLMISFYPLSGLENQTKNGVIFYPNPVKDYLTCAFTEDTPPLSAIEITDIYGRLILSQGVDRSQSTSGSQLDFSQIIPGIYCLRLKYDSGKLSDGILVVKEK